MELKRNILFFPDKEPGKEDAKLRMRIRWGKVVVNFNVGHRLVPAKWNHETQRCTRNTTNLKKVSAAVINSKIQEMQDAAEACFKAFEVAGKVPTADEFRAAYYKEQGKEGKPSKMVSFFDYFDLYVKVQSVKNGWRESTYLKMEGLKSILWEFDKDLTFEKLDESGLNDFITYLREKRGQRNSTVENHLKFVKTFLGWADEQGHNRQGAYKKYKPIFEKIEKTVVALEWEELQKLYNLEIPESKKYLEPIRDVFCFCCFTSLRYSDVANLKKTDIYNDHIQLATIKNKKRNKKRITVDLNNYSRAILEKYKDHEDPANHALPVTSNQFMNRNLKELGQLCGFDRPISDTYFKGSERCDEVKPLWEHLSTHTARRTFITHAIAMNIPPEVIMKWTGHSNYKAMEPYIDMADKIKKKAMKLFNKKEI